MAVDSKDLTYVLASADWFGRFARFSPSQLELYQRRTGELGQHTFLRHPRRVELRSDVIGVHETLQHAGLDALRSMTMTFRQLWMPKKPAEFRKVHKKLRAHVAEDDSGIQAWVWLDEVGKNFSVARREPRAGFAALGDSRRRIEDLVNEDVIDDWLYGVAFHSDCARAQRVEICKRVTHESKGGR